MYVRAQSGILSPYTEYWAWSKSNRDSFPLRAKTNYTEKIWFRQKPIGMGVILYFWSPSKSASGLGSTHKLPKQTCANWLAAQNYTLLAKNINNNFWMVYFISSKPYLIGRSRESAKDWNLELTFLNDCLPYSVAGLEEKVCRSSVITVYAGFCLK